MVAVFLWEAADVKKLAFDVNNQPNVPTKREKDK